MLGLFAGPCLATAGPKTTDSLAEQALGRDLTRGDAVIYWSSYNDKRGG